MTSLEDDEELAKRVQALESVYDEAFEVRLHKLEAVYQYALGALGATFVIGALMGAGLRLLLR